MNALILAAGFGTRMRPFTNTHPKALVPVNGIPLILYSLAFLKKHGIKNIVINLHHHGRVIKKYLGNGKKIGMTIRYSNEPHILGTGGGIKKALRYLDETTLVINGDILMDFSLTSFLAQHNKKSPLATLLLFQHKNARDFGLIHHNQQSVTSILGSPAPHTKDHSAMFTGIYLITKSLLKKELDKHPANKLFCIMRHILIPSLQQGIPLGARLLDGFWHVCDRLSDVTSVEKAINDNKILLSYGEIANKICRLLK